MKERGKYDSFDERAMKAFEPEAKVGLLATVNSEGLPHLTLITAMQAKTPREMIWGQFSEGMSKKYVRENPRTGFLIMTLDRSMWRGTAVWTRAVKKGEDYDMFNMKPMFRYNAYFGIHTVHYMDLQYTYGREGLPLGSIILASLLTAVAKSGMKRRENTTILNSWSHRLYDRLDSLKFLAYVGDDGFPVIVPLLQCQAADSGRLAFSIFAYTDELLLLAPGKAVAVFGLTMDMEDVLTRGRFLGYKRSRGVTLGAVDIEWVYNSMPPMPGQVYPAKALEAIVDF